MESAQYISFRLADETFAVEVARVREILELPHITRVPTAPSFMRGVVNVRGRAIPVVDLRVKFGLPSAAATVESRIIVLEFEHDGETLVVGGLADSVNDVFELDVASITPPPRIAMRWRSDLIHGMGRRGDQFVVLLDVLAVFSLRTRGGSSS